MQFLDPWIPPLKSLISMTARTKAAAFSARFAKVTVDPPPSVARPLTTSS
jgi:hypothetical protein